MSEISDALAAANVAELDGPASEAANGADGVTASSVVAANGAVAAVVPTVHA